MYIDPSGKSLGFASLKAAQLVSPKRFDEAARFLSCNVLTPSVWRVHQQFKDFPLVRARTKKGGNSRDLQHKAFHLGCRMPSTFKPGHFLKYRSGLETRYLHALTITPHDTRECAQKHGCSLSSFMIDSQVYLNHSTQDVDHLA